MNKLIKKNKIKEKPKLFEKDLNIEKLGKPTETIYENHGVSKFEKYILFFMAGIIVFYWVGFFI